MGLWVKRAAPKRKKKNSDVHFDGRKKKTKAVSPGSGKGGGADN